MQTAGYEPIAGTIAGGPVAVTQPITFSLLPKSRRTGDFVTVRGLRAPPPNTSGLNGENRPFLPTEPGCPLQVVDTSLPGSMLRRRRYRRWSAEEKRSICWETRAPGVSVA
jgi:hypothetical protein